MQEEQLDEALDEYDELLKELKQIIGVNLIFMGKRF
jgi:flagellar hook-associated protein FlgK